MRRSDDFGFHTPSRSFPLSGETEDDEFVCLTNAGSASDMKIARHKRGLTTPAPQSDSRIETLIMRA